MQLQLTLPDPQAAAVAGMEKALDHANSVNIGWGVKCWSLFNTYCLRKGIGHRFTCEDFREWAEANGLPKPPNNYAYGGIFNRASRSKMVVKAGIVKSRTHQHASDIIQWQVVDYLPFQ